MQLHRICALPLPIDGEEVGPVDVMREVPKSKTSDWSRLPSSPLHPDASSLSTESRSPSLVLCFEQDGFYDSLGGCHARQGVLTGDLVYGVVVHGAMLTLAFCLDRPCLYSLYADYSQ
jgi:hypothetical protein